MLTPSRGALVPDIDNSIDFDDARNVFIEGDNLEVLKLLQKAYNDQVKLIYIDPPYNTGQRLRLQRRLSRGLRGYLEYTGQLDEDGNRIVDRRRHRRAPAQPVAVDDVPPPRARAEPADAGRRHLRLDRRQRGRESPGCSGRGLRCRELRCATFIWQKHTNREQSTSTFVAMHTTTSCVSRASADSKLPSFATGAQRPTSREQSLLRTPTTTRADSGRRVGRSACSPGVRPSRSIYEVESRPSWTCRSTPPNGRSLGRRLNAAYRRDDRDDGRICFGNDETVDPTSRRYLDAKSSGGRTRRRAVRDRMSVTTEEAATPSSRSSSARSVFDTPKPTRPDSDACWSSDRCPTTTSSWTSSPARARPPTRSLPER